MAKKLARQVIFFECLTCKSKNYTSTKNVNNTKDKLALKKFCTKCRVHAPHKEVKK